MVWQHKRINDLGCSVEKQDSLIAWKEKMGWRRYMKKRARITVAFGMGIVVLGVMGGCTTKQNVSELSEVKVILRYGEVNPEGHIITNTAHYFADRVQELSQGHIEVEVYSSGQLGEETQYYQALKMGALDLYRGNIASISEAGDFEISALALPYIFKNRDHFWAVCNSELGNRLLGNVQEAGSQMVGLCYLDEGPRNFFVTEKPIKNLADMKDLRIRVMPSEMLEDTVRALGAIPVPTAYAELYTSLESESVNGGENPIISYYSNQFYKVAPYYVKDAHTYAPSVILISEITWKRFSEEEKEIICKAARITEEFNKSEIEKADKEAYKKLEDVGVTISEVEDPENWSHAVETVYQKYGAKYMDVIEDVQNIKY
jgi:tripartite ATP-independent transporter DctP family solute receptor